MFLITSINVQNDLVRIFDTSDNSNDIISLSVIAGQILEGNLRVYGMGALKNARRSDAVVLSHLGIYVCLNEAKEALASLYMQRGLSKTDAYRKVGLIA